MKLDNKSTLFGIVLGVALCVLMGAMVVATNADQIEGLLHITIVTSNGSVVSDQYVGDNSTIYINGSQPFQVHTPSNNNNSSATPTIVPGADDQPGAGTGSGSGSPGGQAPVAGDGDITPTPSPSSDASVTPTVTATPSPTPTVVPTATPKGTISGTYHGPYGGSGYVTIMLQGVDSPTYKRTVNAMKSNGGSFSISDIPYGRYHIWTAPASFSKDVTLSSSSTHIDIGSGGDPAPTSVPTSPPSNGSS